MKYPYDEEGNASVRGHILAKDKIVKGSTLLVNQMKYVSFLG
jgi:hypothetical protein